MKASKQVGTRFHLSTLLLLSLTSGALLWANITPRYRYVDTSTGVAVGYYFKMGYGWPFLAQREVRDIYELNPPSPKMLWFKNGFTALVILSGTFVLWEALLARKDVRALEQKCAGE